MSKKNKSHQLTENEYNKTTKVAVIEQEMTTEKQKRNKKTFFK